MPIPEVYTRGAAILLLLSLAACKTWYKPGAEAEEFDQVKLHCEEHTGSSGDEQFLHCMQQSGWSQSTFSASMSNETEFPDEPSPPDPAATPAASDQPASHNQSSTSAADTATGESPDPASIIGWYQFGADEDELDEDRAACKQEPGSDGSFVHCMKRRGWKPMGGKITAGD